MACREFSVAFLPLRLVRPHGLAKFLWRENVSRDFGVRPGVFLSLSRMLTVVLAGAPSVAFEALLRTTLNVSVDSLSASSMMTRLKLLAVSPGAKVSVPEAAV